MDQGLLERVCNAPGVPGYEDEAQAVVMETLRASCGEVRQDRLGNVIGLRKATRPPADGAPLKVVLAAHVDEIGMMVKHIDSNGFIRFEPMGGLNAQAIVSQRVVIHGRKPVGAVVVPDTRGDSKDKVTKVEEAFLDTGLPRDALRELVDVGDVVTFAPGVEQLNEKIYVGRNVDDRIGTYCLLEAMRRVGDTAVDVYAVSSVQEEVGLRGMRPAAYAIEPDLGIAIDGSLTWGPYAEEHECTCTLGKGTRIYIMDCLTIGDRWLGRLSPKRPSTILEYPIVRIETDQGVVGIGEAPVDIAFFGQTFERCSRCLAGNPVGPSRFRAGVALLICLRAGDIGRLDMSGSCLEEMPHA